MIRKAIGIVLVIVAAVIAAVLLINGRPLIPHMIGPITLAVIGMFLLIRNRNADRSLK